VIKTKKTQEEKRERRGRDETFYAVVARAKSAPRVEIFHLSSKKRPRLVDRALTAPSARP
jgi:hypothetical protein